MMASENNIKYFSIFFILLTYSLPTEQKHSRRDDDNQIEEDNDPPVSTENVDDIASDTDCWLSLSPDEHLTAMDNLDQKYAKVRSSFHRKVASRLNANMLKAILDTRGMAYRAIHNTAGDTTKIPAGLNLGGHCMLVMEDSILFFYRMKLRNSTEFQVNYLENDLMNMTVDSHLSLNDLHLIGAYERSPIHKDPSILFYVPNAGEIEVLLKNVNYKMEGRLRLQGNRLVVETVFSEFSIEDVLMTYTNSENPRPPTSFQPENLDDFLDRIKNDLDLWLKDYYNDYYTYFQLEDVDPEFRQYEKSRIVEYNLFSDNIVKKIKQRIYDSELFHVITPKFTLNALPNVQVQLSNGVIRGLDTMYKKSLATGRITQDIRHIDMTIGFSSLKMEYKLDVILPNGGTEISGRLQLAADDLTAQLQVSMVKDHQTVDLNFNFIKQLKPLALTVEGAANRVIANYKHLLENYVIILMLNELLVSVKNLGTLTRCKPNFDSDHKQHPYLRTNETENNISIMQAIAKAYEYGVNKTHSVVLFDKDTARVKLEYGKEKADSVLEFGKKLVPKLQVYIQMSPDSPPMGPVLISLVP